MNAVTRSIVKVVAMAARVPMRVRRHVALFAASESIDIAANGSRVRFFRDVANITMDVDDTERVDLRALGGIDNTVVNDLSATDVKNIVLDLATDGRDAMIGRWCAGGHVAAAAATDQTKRKG